VGRVIKASQSVAKGWGENMAQFVQQFVIWVIDFVIAFLVCIVAWTLAECFGDHNDD